MIVDFLFASKVEQRGRTEKKRNTSKALEICHKRIKRSKENREKETGKESVKEEMKEEKRLVVEYEQERRNYGKG